MGPGAEGPRAEGREKQIPLNERIFEELKYFNVKALQITEK